MYLEAHVLTVGTLFIKFFGNISWDLGLKN